MLFTARSAAVYGIDAHIIEVEVDFARIKLDKNISDGGIRMRR